MAFLPLVANAESPRVMRRSSAFLGVRLSVHGMLAGVVSLLVWAAAFTSEANLLLLLFGISAGVFVFSIAACIRAVRRLDVQRLIPDAMVAGRPCRGIYTVRSRRRWQRCWSIRISEIPTGRGSAVFSHAFVPVIEPRQELRVEVDGATLHRGRVFLRGIRVSCSFPFGLVSCFVDIDAPEERIVFPTVGRIRRDILRQMGGGEGAVGRQGTRASGQDEFHGVREYRQGDNPRWIHWKQSARTGRLVIREHLAAGDSQLILLVDPWCVGTQARESAGNASKGRRDGIGPLHEGDVQAERIISAAATVLCDALDRGLRVGLICRAAVPIVVAPAGGRSHRQRLLRELALLEAGSGVALDEMVAGIRWSGRWNARCIVLSADGGGGAHQQLTRLLASRNASVMVIGSQAGGLDRLFESPEVGGELRRAV